MTGGLPVLRSTGRTLTLLVLLGLSSLRLAAQPLNTPNAPALDSNNLSGVTTSAVPTAESNAATNSATPSPNERYDSNLAMARYCQNTREYANAEKLYVSLLGEGVPDSLQRTALFELANVARAENDLPRAQAIYTQYLQRWPGDVRTPDVYLHQGQVFREMDLPNMALAKFYGVMTTALSLTNNQWDYYKRLVLQAQVEIAETYYLTGKFKDAVDYYSRLINQNEPELDREQIQFRLIRSLEAIKHSDEVVHEAQDFLSHYASSLEEPEVHYHLAEAYKAQNRDTEALQEVKLFLQEERDKTTNNPAVWSYWQQRVGNEIGNQLYQQGDYLKALQVYMALTQLDQTPAWQLPVRYQVGLTYEKLLQPQLAMEAYRNLLTNGVSKLSTNLTPSLKSVVDMATWRLSFLEWNARAAPFVHPTVATLNTNLNPSLP